MERGGREALMLPLMVSTFPILILLPILAKVGQKREHSIENGNVIT